MVDILFLQHIRKKKLSTHWRSFIRPLMWRCKWTELKIKELESQALKYSRELEANEQTKMLELHQYSSDFCSKSFPFFSHPGKKKPMRRRKRKLVENATDVSSYMSHHQLFSYLGNKSFLWHGDDTFFLLINDQYDGSICTQHLSWWYLVNCRKQKVWSRWPVSSWGWCYR